MNITWFEFLLAWLNGLGCVLFLAAFIPACGFIVFMVNYFMESFDRSPNKEITGRYGRWAGICLVTAILAGLLASLPNIDSLWRVRIALIKFQLASPENVGKAADHIEEIGKRLECKYLQMNCPEKEKKDGTKEDNRS